MRIRDLMTANPITVAPEDSLETVIGTMLQHKIHELPVMENGDLMGIITDRDVKMALGPDARRLDLDAIDPRQLEGEVEWFMTPGVETMEAEASVGDAFRKVVQMRVGAFPIVHNGDLVGILSVTDLLKAAIPHFE